LEDDAEDFAAIGRALRLGGDLRLWSCYVGAGATGENLIRNLERATGAEVAASARLVGAADLGGNWQLDARPRVASVTPPLTEFGIAAYSAVMITGGDYD